MILAAQIGYVDPSYLVTQYLYVTSGRHLISGTQTFLPIINPGFTYETNLFSQGTTKGSVTIGVGQLVLNNINGSLDFLRNCGMDGQTIKMWVLNDENDVPLSDSKLYFYGTIFYAALDFDIVTIYIKDKTEQLNIPAQPIMFAGTNNGATGLEGTASDIGGKPKPIIYGRNMSVPIYQINAVTLMYGCNYDKAGNTKAIYRIWNVYDKGGKLQAGADYATSAALQSATIAPGYYATCLAAAQIRLGSVPQGTVTADIDEAALATANVPAIVRRFLTDQGYTDGVDFHGGSLDQLQALNNCPAGIWITDTSATQLSVCTDLLSSMGAWMYPDMFGIFDFGRFDLPANITNKVSAMTVTNNHYKTGTLKRQMTGDQNYGIPAATVTLQHTKRWQPQLATDLLPSLEPSLVSFLGKSNSTSSGTNAAVKTLHVLAPTLDYDSLLVGPMGNIVINSGFDYPILPSSSYSPVGTVNNGISAGWYFSTSGTGKCAQGSYGVQLIPNTASSATLTQTLTTPDQIAISNSYTLSIQASTGLNTTVTIIQNGVTLASGVLSSFGSAVASLNQFTFTTQDNVTAPVIITISAPAAGNVAIINSVYMLQAGLSQVLTGQEFNAALAAAGFWNSVLTGTGASVTQASSKITLVNSATGTAGITCTLSVPDQIRLGQVSLAVYISAGTSGTISVKQGAGTLATVAITGIKAYTLNFNLTSSANPIVVSIVNTVAGGNVVISYAILSEHVVCNLVNPTFTLPVVQANNNVNGGGSLFNSPSLNGGWYFSTSGTAGTYAQNTASQLVLTSTIADSAVATQVFQMPDQLQPGKFSISTIVVASTSGTATLTVIQGATTLLTQALVVGTNTATFTVVAGGGATVTVAITSTGAGSLTLDSTAITEVLGTLAPSDEAARLLTLESAGLERYTFELEFADGWKLKPGYLLTLLEARFSLTLGKLFNVIGMKHDIAADNVSVDIAG